MAISITHDHMPTSSNWYTASGTGSESITLSGISKIVVHSKKDLIKIQVPQDAVTYTSKNTDEFENQVVDMKKGTDEIVISGYLEDDSTDTAWNKLWKLRAMCSRGGPLTNLTIDNVEFKSTTQLAFLEDVVGTSNPDDSGALNTNKADDRARIELVLSFFIGGDRYSA